MNTRWTQEQIFFDDNTKNKKYGVGYYVKKSKIKLKGKRHGGFIFIFTILLAVLIYFIVNISGSVVSVFASKQENKAYISQANYYAVSLANFSENQSAVIVANDCKNIGGAGYIYEQDSLFYVLTSVYPTLNQAQSVQNKLQKSKYTQTSIVNIQIEQKDYSALLKKISSQNEDVFINYLGVFDNAFDVFYSLSVQYDKSNITFSACKQQILFLYSKYKPMYDTLMQVNQSLKDEQLTKLLSSSQNILSLMQNSSNILTIDTNFSCNLKYCAIQVCEIRKNL